MARKDGNEIVWTAGDLAALNNEKTRLEDLIDAIEGSSMHEARTAYQDACAALAWQDLGSPGPGDMSRDRGASSQGKTPAQGKKRPKR